MSLTPIITVVNLSGEREPMGGAPYIIGIVTGANGV